MLMYFIVTTLAFTTAILLAGLISFMLLFSKTFSKWYAKKIQKFTVELCGEELFTEYKFDKEETV